MNKTEHIFLTLLSKRSSRYYKITMNIDLYFLIIYKNINIMINFKGTHTFSKKLDKTSNRAKSDNP